MIEPRGSVDIRQVGVYGHEFGAAVALDRAANDSRVRALALSSPLTEPETGFSAAARNSWASNADARLEGPDGRIHFLPHNFVSDWRSKGRQALARAAESLKIPLLLLSGSESPDDFTNDARRLFFRQPTHARLTSLSSNQHFSHLEERLSAHLADFFAEQFGLTHENNTDDHPKMTPNIL